MLKRFMKEEDGLATLEIILIVVVLVGLVWLFRGQITKFFEAIMEKIGNLVNQINSAAGTPSNG